MTVLVTYGTKHGSTREVAEAIAATLRNAGSDVALEPAGAVRDVTPYDAVVLGGSLYAGRWHPDARHLLSRHREELARRPVAVFALGPKTLADDEVAQSRLQLTKALSDVPEVRPAATAVFGGVVDPKRLHFPFNHMPASDARDWDAIRDWALEFERSRS
jgi:menaquinone-dependent protoporphyrinogen oxidase